MKKNIEDDKNLQIKGNSQENKSNDPYSSRKKLIYFCFTFIGLANNVGYVLIITSAQQFASKVNDDTLIAFYPLALIIFNSLSRIINSKMCIRVTYFKRALGLSIYFCFGYLLLFTILTIIDNNEGFNQKLAFFLTLIPAVIMGTGLSFGETTFLGYIRTFPEDYVSGWSSGTGFAGVCGASLSLLFKLINEDFDLKYLYLIMSPITVLYFLSFYITYKIKKNIDDKNNSAKEMIEYVEEEENEENKDIEIRKNLPENSDGLLEAENNAVRATDVSKNKKMSFKNFPLAFKYGKRYILNLFIVYFLEYTVCSGFSERANTFKYINSKNMFFEKAQYETFLLCYQIGVFISRSSLFIFKHLAFIELLNIFQFINFIFWFIEAEKGIISNQWICFSTLIFLGICGGGVYVVCLYYILNDNKIPLKYKELCLNIGTIFNDLGVLLSSIVCIILDNTIMKDKN